MPRRRARYIYIYIYRCLDAGQDERGQNHMCMYMCACTHARTHTHTRTHTQARITAMHRKHLQRFAKDLKNLEAYEELKV